MTRKEPLDARKEQILAAVVRAHISTGEPVSSAAIAGRAGLEVSPATVRNEMAALEEAGYLQQPHTSAGRVPTATAFELYAGRVASKARLRAADRRWLDRNLAGESDAERLLGRVPHVLSELCHGVGLVLVPPPLAGTLLGQVRFVVLDNSRLLAVIITRDGRVCDRVLRPRDRYRPDELDRMSAYLNENFRGWALGAIRKELERRVAAERSQFLRQAAALCQESFQAADPAGALQMEGVAHLVERMEATDPDSLHDLLAALEEKERLARLLRDCLESRQASPRIQIGLERLTPAMKDFALIGAPYGHGSGMAGSLGLLGPWRMDYARAITAVAHVAALFDRLLAEN